MRYPEEGLTGIAAAKDETLLLEVKGFAWMDQISMNHFTIAVEAVNARSAARNQPPLILLLHVE